MNSTHRSQIVHLCLYIATVILVIRQVTWLMDAWAPILLLAFFFFFLSGCRFFRAAVSLCSQGILGSLDILIMWQPPNFFEFLSIMEILLRDAYYEIFFSLCSVCCCWSGIHCYLHFVGECTGLPASMSACPVVNSGAGRAGVLSLPGAAGHSAEEVGHSFKFNSTYCMLCVQQRSSQETTPLKFH